MQRIKHKKIVEGAGAVLIDSFYENNEQNVETIEKIKTLRGEVARAVVIIYDVYHIYI